MPYLLDKINATRNSTCSGSQHVGGNVSICMKLLKKCVCSRIYHVRVPRGKARAGRVLCRCNDAVITFFWRLTDFLLQSIPICSKYEGQGIRQKSMKLGIFFSVSPSATLLTFLINNARSGSVDLLRSVCLHPVTQHW